MLVFLVVIDRLDGTGKGHLKYKVVDAAAVGLVVDNSSGSSQSRVYLTSGNTTGAGVHAYPPGAEVSLSAGRDPST
jgi:hypothetical protein